MDTGGRFGVGIVISGLAEVTVIKRMKIQGVGLSSKQFYAHITCIFVIEDSNIPNLHYS